jgi:hypothetical protein
LPERGAAGHDLDTPGGVNRNPHGIGGAETAFLDKDRETGADCFPRGTPPAQPCLQRVRIDCGESLVKQAGVIA